MILALAVTLEHEDDDPGTNWNTEAREREPDRISPRQAWRAIDDQAAGTTVFLEVLLNQELGEPLPPRRHKGAGSDRWHRSC